LEKLIVTVNTAKQDFNSYVFTGRNVVFTVAKWSLYWNQVSVVEQRNS